MIGETTMSTKAEFAVKILLEYAHENGINGRDTTDLQLHQKKLDGIRKNADQLNALVKHITSEES